MSLFFRDGNKEIHIGTLDATRQSEEELKAEMTKRVENLISTRGFVFRGFASTDEELEDFRSDGIDPTIKYKTPVLWAFSGEDSIEGAAGFAIVRALGRLSHGQKVRAVISVYIANHLNQKSNHEYVPKPGHTYLSALHKIFIADLDFGEKEKSGGERKLILGELENLIIEYEEFNRELDELLDIAEHGTLEEVDYVEEEIERLRNKMSELSSKISELRDML